MAVRAPGGAEMGRDKWVLRLGVGLGCCTAYKFLEKLPQARPFRPHRGLHKTDFYKMLLALSRWQEHHYRRVSV